MLLEIIVLPRQPGAPGLPRRELRLSCDVCHAEYRKQYCRDLIDATVHRCSLKCVYGSRSTDGLGGHDGAENKNCRYCDKTFKVWKSQLDRKWGRFCSRTCYARFRSEHKDLYADSIAAMQTNVAKEKSRITNEKRRASPEYVHPRIGVQHTEESRKKISDARLKNPLVGERNGMFGRHHTAESRQAMSEKHAELILNGKQTYGKNNHVSGKHISEKSGKEMHYRSSWEKAFMLFLDRSPDVVSYEYESCKIPYMLRNNKRWYIPDFIVTYSDDRRIMFEIKPVEFVDNLKTKCKTWAACEFALREGISGYFILTRQELTELGILS